MLSYHKLHCNIAWEDEDDAVAACFMNRVLFFRMPYPTYIYVMIQGFSLELSILNSL